MPSLYALVAESVDATDFKKNEGDIMNIYKQKDGRRFIVYKGSDNKYHSKSYARYLMEQYLGRELTDREEVHHKDHNKTNDVIENLEVKDKTVHRKEHFKKATTIEHCYICKKEIVVDSRRRANHYRSKNKNPDKWFCSKHCSGIFGQKEQQNRKLSD